MAEQQSWITDARRWTIDTIYGHPKSYGFCGFFLALALVWLLLLGTVTGHLVGEGQDCPIQTQGQITCVAPVRAAAPGVATDDAAATASDRGFVRIWLFPHPIFRSTILAALLTIPILFGFPWFLYRQMENRRYYRRMYGSFYHRA